MSKKARATFIIEKEDWEKFQQITTNLGSNASVELRRFVKVFNQEKKTWSFKKNKE